MPQQQMDIRALNMGPFAQQLYQPFVPPRNPAGEAGYGGGLTAAAHFASSFLGGAAHSRMQNMLQQEQQRSRNIQALNALLEQSERMGLTPNAKQQFQGEITQRLLGEVATADHGGAKGKKAGGNPIWDIGKNIASMMVGGPMPQKVAPIDENYIGTTFQNMHALPKLNDVMLKVDSLFAEAIKGAGSRLEEDVMQHPSFEAARTEALTHGIPFDQIIAQKKANGTILSLNNPRDVMAYRFARGINKPAQNTATPAAPQVAGMPTPAVKPINPEDGSEVIQEPPPITSGPGPSADAANPNQMNLGGYMRQVTGAAPAAPAEPPPLTNTPQQRANTGRTPRQDLDQWRMVGFADKTPSRYKRPDGSVFNGQMVFNPMGGWDGNIYDPSTNQYYYDAFPSGLTDPKGLTPEQIAATGVEAENTIAASEQHLGKPYATWHERARNTYKAYVAAGMPEKGLAAVNSILQSAQSAAQSDRSREDSQSQTRALYSLANPAIQNLTPGETKMVIQTRDKVQQNPLMKTYGQVQQIWNMADAAYQRYKAGDKAATGVLDQALITAAARMVDPSTGVRPAEVQAWEAAVPAFARLTILGEKILKGQKIDERTRDEMILLMKTTKAGTEQAIRGMVEPDVASIRGLLGNRYTPEIESMLIPSFGGVPAGGAAAPGTNPYENKGGANPPKPTRTVPPTPKL